MKKIKLTKGYYTLVDDDKFEFLSQFKWHYSNGYAMRRVGKKILQMHRVLLNTPVGKDTDHINRYSLDNRLVNLRICNRSENNLNKPKQSNNTSGFKGVFWRNDKKLWRARVGNKYAGMFKSKIDAAKAYDKVAKKIYGDFAKLNFNV